MGGPFWSFLLLYRVFSVGIGAVWTLNRGRASKRGSVSDATLSMTSARRASPDGR